MLNPNAAREVMILSELRKSILEPDYRRQHSYVQELDLYAGHSLLSLQSSMSLTSLRRAPLLSHRYHAHMFEDQVPARWQ